MINYLERVLFFNEEAEEEEAEFPSNLNGTVQNIKKQLIEKTTEEQGAAGARLEQEPWNMPPEAEKRDDRLPAVVWRVKRDLEESAPLDETSGTDPAGETQQTKTGLQQVTEVNKGQKWTELKSAFVQAATENGTKTGGAAPEKVSVKNLGCEEETERWSNGENTKAIVQNAEMLYCRAVALGNQASYQKPGAGVALIDSGTQKHSVDPTELDRAFQKDARRYNSEFTLF